MKTFTVTQTISYDRSIKIQAESVGDALKQIHLSGDDEWDIDIGYEVLNQTIESNPILKKYQVLRHETYIAYVEAKDLEEAESKAIELDMIDFKEYYKNKDDGIDITEVTE